MRHVLANTMQTLLVVEFKLRAIDSRIFDG